MMSTRQTKPDRIGAGLASTLVAGAWLMAASWASAAVLFSDDFSAGPSPLWGNESGDWVASGGGYYATAPNNAPNAYSSLPFTLTDFSLDFDINAVTDGGIFLRAAAVPGSPLGIKGILLNFKVPFGEPRVYWHVFYDGTNASGPLNLQSLDYGPNPHVHIEVNGNTYSAYVNGSLTPVTTLTDATFGAGRVALYDFSSQTFGNVVLQIPEPQLSIRMDADAAVIYWSTNFTGFLLQTTPDMGGGANGSVTWSTLNGPYASADGFYQVRLPQLNLLSKQYFRLIRAGP